MYKVQGRRYTYKADMDRAVRDLEVESLGSCNLSIAWKGLLGGCIMMAETEGGSFDILG